MIKISKFKLGDKVIVEDVLESFAYFVPSLVTHIGLEGVVDATDGDDSLVHVVFDGGDNAWLPDCSLTKDGDTKHIKKWEIHHNQTVFIGKPLHLISYTSVTEELNAQYPCLVDEVDIVQFDSLYGKYGKIVNDHRFMTTEHILGTYNKLDSFIGIEVEGQVYYVPQCAVFSAQPSYSPKKICYNV